VVPQPVSANFGFLARHDPLLVSLGTLAERYFSVDPVTALTKLRLYGEVLAQHLASNVALPKVPGEQQAELLQRLRNARYLPDDVAPLFHVLRKLGNDAIHEHKGTHADALSALKLARQLGTWFHRSFGGGKGFNPGPFLPPVNPANATKALQAELERLREQLSTAQLTAEALQAQAAQEAQARLDAEARAQQEKADRAVWEQLAAEAESKLLATLSAAEAKAAAQKPEQLRLLTDQLAETGSALDIDEADTRLLIDAQLRQAGWEADSQALRYDTGARPVPGKNLAISEWPTEKTWRADYVLFCGLEAVAVVEAKRKAKDVSGALQQSRRYSESFNESPEARCVAGYPWGKCRIPFLFATNGRAYLKQLETKSGIWFQDVRRPSNLPRALAGWPTPEGLKDELKKDVDAATEKLKDEDPSNLAGLRPYQLKAISAVEGAIASGKRQALVSMATGTGKTRTFIGLIYRLVKTGRFRRVLFLVDRNVLGEQAATAFKNQFVDDTRKFSDVFNLKELADLKPDAETRLHFATVQAVAKRLFQPSGGEGPELHVDDYDCIVVDECHRGYTLDREMSESELAFRSQEDYLSVYRRVLDYFDAVKVGLTATPALHTVEIFGAPVYEYRYREAVVDGFLVDHEPPIRITTELSDKGIHFAAGEKTPVYLPEKGQLEMYELPDEVDFEVESFNKQVITENFNKVVCEELARQVDPSLPGKTLIFCANDAHADLAVKLLLDAFKAKYGEVDANTVKKVTGASDKPLELIRRYKNERLPSVAVTVDLLTTGVDVPAISNLVFLRRVRSRILYEQMLGRATRLHSEGDYTKESFRIFDAVDLYAALEDHTSMKPVVADPKVSFAQLAEELAKLEDGEPRQMVMDQLLAKLQRKKRTLGEGRGAEQFQAAAGGRLEEVLAELKEKTPGELSTWLASHGQLVGMLDRVTNGRAPVFVSEHEDALAGVTEGYGEGRARPEEYLDGFGRFLKENAAKLPALMMVTQRPRELTREELRKLKLALDEEGFTETQLRSAYKATKNADIAATIMGFIRQRALGEPLKPYTQRVDEATQRVLRSRAWSDEQVRWLKRISDAIKENEVIDRPLLDEGAFRSKGGFDRINKVFDGKLEEVVEQLKDAVWRAG
jgi:type I restriction enzyme R subunit